MPTSGGDKRFLHARQLQDDSLCSWLRPLASTGQGSRTTMRRFTTCCPRTALLKENRWHVGLKNRPVLTFLCVSPVQSEEMPPDTMCARVKSLHEFLTLHDAVLDSCTCQRVVRGEDECKSRRPIPKWINSWSASEDSLGFIQFTEFSTAQACINLLFFLTSSNVISHRKKSPVLSVAQDSKQSDRFFFQVSWLQSLTSVGQGYLTTLETIWVSHCYCRCHCHELTDGWIDGWMSWLMDGVINWWANCLME